LPAPLHPVGMARDWSPSGGAPITIRHGDILMHIRDPSLLESSLAALKNAFQKFPDAHPPVAPAAAVHPVVATAQAAQDRISQHFGENLKTLASGVSRVRSALDPSIARRLDLLNKAASYIRHAGAAIDHDFLRTLDRSLEKANLRTSEQPADVESGDRGGPPVDPPDDGVRAATNYDSMDVGDRHVTSDESTVDSARGSPPVSSLASTSLAFRAEMRAQFAAMERTLDRASKALS